MEGFAALGVVVTLMIVSWKWPWVSWVLATVIGILAVAIIVVDESRHDDFLDGIGTIIGGIGLLYAAVLVGLGFAGRYLRKRRAEAARERDRLAPARVIGR
jgi:ABC-type uncharacterized transport system permease subunit